MCISPTKKTKTKSHSKRQRHNIPFPLSKITSGRSLLRSAIGSLKSGPSTCPHPADPPTTDSGIQSHSIGRHEKYFPTLSLSLSRVLLMRWLSRGKNSSLPFPDRSSIPVEFQQATCLPCATCTFSLFLFIASCFSFFIQLARQSVRSEEPPRVLAFRQCWRRTASPCSPTGASTHRHLSAIHLRCLDYPPNLKNFLPPLKSSGFRIYQDHSFNYFN